VLVHLDNCPELLVTWFACAWIGAVCVTTNVHSTGPELAYFADRIDAVGAVTQPRHAALLGTHCRGLRWMAVTADDAGQPPAPGTAPQAGERFDALHGTPPAPRDADAHAPLCIMFTSGTTSRPKPVLWTHANALWSAQLGALQQGLRPEDRCQVYLPLFHVVGLAWSVLPAVWAGATVVLQPRFSARGFWPAALAHGSTVASHVTFGVNLLREQAAPAHRFRLWQSGTCRPDLEAHFRVKMTSAWGMTEVCAQAITGSPWEAQRAGSVGRASVGYAVHVVDDAGAPAAFGEAADLLIGGVAGLSLFARYDGDAAATAEAFDDRGRFITGDRVVLHEDGHIDFVERSKDVIKVGGENVSAAEVERAVLEVAGVREAAAVARTDPVYGQTVAVFVALGPDADALAWPQRIVAHCAARLAKFKVPRQVVVVDALPRGHGGKLLKADLRSRINP
jgi:crotonobetaine/carnitine-CoA ligase